MQKHAQQRYLDAKHVSAAELTSVVVVASEQQAASVQSVIDETNATHHQQGVIIVRPETEVGMLRALGDMDATRQQLGLPGIEVIDLREQGLD